MELLLAISILSIIMLFLYETLATLHKTNTIYGERLDVTSKQEKFLKTFSSDMSLAIGKSVTIQNLDKDGDILLFQTSHSVHQRIMPYVGYIYVDEVLYRIEASEKFTYPLTGDEEMVVDSLGAVKRFRIYRTKTHYLLDMQHEGEQPILFKIRALN